MDHFKEDIDNNLKNNIITEYSNFQNIFLEILHKHLLCNTKKDYFQKLDIKDLTDNKEFWKTISSLFLAIKV